MQRLYDTKALSPNTSLELKSIHIPRINIYYVVIIKKERCYCRFQEVVPKTQVQQENKARLLAVKTLYTALILFSIISSPQDHGLGVACLFYYRICFLQLPVPTHMAKPNCMGSTPNLLIIFLVFVWLHMCIHFYDKF